MFFSPTKLTAVAFLLGLALAYWVHSCDRSLVKLSQGPTNAPAVPPEKHLHQSAPTPSRIVVFSPAAVEMLFALGGGNHIAGVTRFATFPEEVKKLPVLGGLMDMNFERLTTLNPDFIIAQTADEKIRNFAATRNIPFLHLTVETIRDVYHAIETLGELIARQKESKALIQAIKQDLSLVKQAVSKQKPVPCFISVDRSPGNLNGLLSIGRDGFLAEIVEIAGGRNVFSDLTRRYPVISKEALVARAPQVILEFKPGISKDDEALSSLREDWLRFQTVPAAKSDRVYIVRSEGSLRAGPKMAETARQIAEILHPLAFEKVVSSHE